MRATARRIAAASSMATFEDLGVQMNRHSTLVSYLHKLLVLLTGNFGKPGAGYRARAVRAARGRQGGRRRRARRTPVTGARVIGGLTPVQRDPGGDPHRSPEALPRDARRERQPRALARRQRAHARGDRRARSRGGDRRGDDRDRAARPLRAAGGEPVREGRGDVLQLRVPAQLLPSAQGADARRCPACSPRRSCTRGWSRRSARCPPTRSRSCARPGFDGPRGIPREVLRARRRGAAA